MITKEEYKKQLINAYYNEINNTAIRKKYRKEKLQANYNDEYLNKIIIDTYNFIKKIFNKIKDNQCKIELKNSLIFNLSLDFIDSYVCDRLYIDVDGNIISSRILKYVFGQNLIVALNIEEKEEYNFAYDSFLYLQNFPKNMKEIKNDLFGISRIRK